MCIGCVKTTPTHLDIATTPKRRRVIDVNSPVVQVNCIMCTVLILFVRHLLYILLANAPIFMCLENTDAWYCPQGIKTLHTQLG